MNPFIKHLKKKGFEDWKNVNKDHFFQLLIKEDKETKLSIRWCFGEEYDGCYLTTLCKKLDYFTMVKLPHIKTTIELDFLIKTLKADV